MLNNKYRIILVTLLVLAISASTMVLANGTGKFKVSRTMYINGSEIKAGVYDVTWESNSPEATVVFMAKGKPVLTVKGKIEEAAKEFDYNSITLGKDTAGHEAITSLQFRGGKTAVIF